METKEKQVVLISKIIENRRAVYPRQYNKEPVEKEEIQQVLEAANWAPTHRRTEPWRFKVIRGERLTEFGAVVAQKYKETTPKFSERKYKGIQEKFDRSACVIAICMQRDLKERVPEWEEIASTAMAVQNMWLTTSELGIGAYWSSPDVRMEVGDFLGLQDGERCLGFFYMGRYDGPLPEGTRQPLEDKVKWL